MHEGHELVKRLLFDFRSTNSAKQIGQRRCFPLSETHHGTYEITGPDTFSMAIDIEIHMDPKIEMQDTPVWYGESVSLEGAHYSVDGDNVVIDLPSSAQLVLQRIE